MSDIFSIDLSRKYEVKWNNQILQVEILNSRKNDVTLEEEYYVHYLNKNSRLDEWITADSFVKHPSLFPKKSRKRRRKSEEDEMKTTQFNSFIKNESSGSNEIKIKNIDRIYLGNYLINTWYYSPYPEKFTCDGKMYLCPYCLNYMKKLNTLINHLFYCHLASPPGKIIYFDVDKKSIKQTNKMQNEMINSRTNFNNSNITNETLLTTTYKQLIGSKRIGLSLFEIDGFTNNEYCQNLCLLAKFFIESKTLVFDISHFKFYVLCEVDEYLNHHIVGYFSKEKQSSNNYNLNCILVLPPFQKRGYGKFLISVSYEISVRDGIPGSPEKPLSDLGKISYRSYWAYVILKLLQEKVDSIPDISNENINSELGLLRCISIDRISNITGICKEDVILTLNAFNMIQVLDGEYIISFNKVLIDTYLVEAKNMLLCKPHLLTYQSELKALKKKDN